MNKIEKLKHTLSDIKIKKNVDYCIMHKNDHYHLMCNSMFTTIIKEYAEETGIEFDTVLSIDV